MRGRSEWSALLALAAALAACDGGSPPSALESANLTPSPREPLSPRGVAPSPDHRAKDLYFVELEEAPTSRGGHLDRLLAERARFHQRARRSGVELHERYTYTRLWNGLSARVTEDQLAMLRAVTGVKAVFPVHTVELDDTPSGNVRPDLFTALAMTGADIAQSTLGLTGQKVLVGVIDSGVDYDHPDLGGCFGVGCRVVMGHDFVGDSYDAGDSTTLPEPDGDPDDCAGHGTHVAGIIGANGLVKGVAPAVSFAAYRVFGCKGSAGTDVIVKAMETAAADGVRVVNMSLGTSFVWPETPEAQAANQLVKSGVVVVASIGNSGATGLWAAGAPGNADLVIGTASVENTAVAGPAFQISPHAAMASGGLLGFNAAAGSPVIPTTGTLPLTRTGTVTSTDDACAELAANSLTGQIALVRRGGCTFFDKATHAEAAGAAGVILYNNEPEALNPSVAGSPAITVPVVGISGEDGESLNAQLDAGSATLSWGTSVVTAANPLADTLSAFSSLGLTAELGLKPDIAAPGGSIYSTWPLELGAYASESGTSMASPHVAGAAALLIQARPGLSATRVREILQNNAVPALDVDGAVADSVHRQGAGLVHIDAAVLNLVRATPSKIALGESQSGPVTTQVTLTNEGSSAKTYAVTHVPALSTTGTTYAPTPLAGGYATAVFDVPSLTVAAGGSASVSATITANPTLEGGGLYGGYLVFTPQGAGATGTLRVPYSGFKGDYQALTILAPTADGYPWLIDKTGAHKPHGATFTLQGGDLPRVVAHFEHAARQVKMDIVEATTHKAWGRALLEDYYPQNSATVVDGDATNAAFTFPWNGKTTLNTNVVAVPNGKYRIELRVLKALGDAANATDWEVWTSPVVTINHP